MDKHEMKMQLIHKKMECIAKLKILRFLGVNEYEKELDEMLDRLNDIEAILRELDKK